MAKRLSVKGLDNREYRANLKIKNFLNDREQHILTYEEKIAFKNILGANNLRTKRGVQRANRMMELMKNENIENLSRFKEFENYRNIYNKYKNEGMKHSKSALYDSVAQKDKSEFYEESRDLIINYNKERKKTKGKELRHKQATKELEWAFLKFEGRKEKERYEEDLLNGKDWF